MSLALIYLQPFLTQLLWYENGTKYNQLAILNDDFTLNYDKLAVEVSIRLYLETGCR